MKELELLMSKLKEARSDTVPTGFKSAVQYATDWNKGLCHSGAVLRKAVAQKLAEERTFRIGGRPIKHYKLKLQ